MAGISISSFGGISPRTPSRLLNDNQAQIALGCPMFSGSLQPLNDVGPVVVDLPKVGTPKSIYRFGQNLDSDGQYWFHWTGDVSVARGAIAGDTTERTYFCGDGAYPKVTDNSIALDGGAEYPIASYRLGVPRPVDALIATVSGAAEEGALAETRVYAYTWVNQWDEESEPSAPSNEVDVVRGQTVELTSFSDAPAGEWVLNRRRIYRATSGTYLFVAEISAGATFFEDTVLADDLAEEIPSLNWQMPPDDLQGIVAGANGIMAGFTGSDVMFCDPYHPFAWPAAYSNTVDYPVVGIGVIDTTFVVLTRGTPYFIQGGHPDSMTVVKSDIELACVSAKSIVSFSGDVVYASPDGLVSITPGGSKLVTESLFTRAQWQSMFKPDSIHAYHHDLKYVAFYDNGVDRGGFVFDFATGTFMMHSIYATAGFNDLVKDTLFLAFEDRTVRKWMGGDPVQYTWKSKKFTLPEVTGFSCARVGAESYPVTVTLLADGATVYEHVATDRSAFRLPSTVGRDWEVQLTGDAEVFAFSMAQAMEELQLG